MHSAVGTAAFPIFLKTVFIKVAAFSSDVDTELWASNLYVAS
jgi:hypothetical protein